MVASVSAAGVERIVSSRHIVNRRGRMTRLSAKARCNNDMGGSRSAADSGSNSEAYSHPPLLLLPWHGM